MNAELTLPDMPRRTTVFGTLEQRHSLWWRAALASGALMVVCAFFMLFDERTLNGVSVWWKPLKFSLSIGVYFATLAWFAPLLPNGYLEARKGRWLTFIPIACAVFELAYIVLQASRGQASHFNNTSVFYSAMYSLMGVGAVALISICLWMGAVILRNHGAKNPYTLAVGLGLVLTFVLGGGFGSYLSAHVGHWVGGSQTDANGLWLVKWSRDGGDLRVAHFFGIHSMQVLPMVGALVSGRLPLRAAIGAVVLAAFAYVGVTTFTFVQAVQGAPFF